VLIRHEAALGYSTCFWHNVRHSEAIFDPRGWYRALQVRAQAPYPEGLRQAIVKKNHAVLRTMQSSYREQIALAPMGNDVVSVQHRMTALLASFFDIWFALRRQPHPGEKRLLDALPEPWRSDVRDLVQGGEEELLQRLDRLPDLLDGEIAKHC
jgi:hypothetical protein